MEGGEPDELRLEAGDGHSIRAGLCGDESVPQIVKSDTGGMGPDCPSPEATEVAPRHVRRCSGITDAGVVESRASAQSPMRAWLEIGNAEPNRILLRDGKHASGCMESNTGGNAPDCGTPDAINGRPVRAMSRAGGAGPATVELKADSGRPERAQKNADVGKPGLPWLRSKMGALEFAESNNATCKPNRVKPEAGTAVPG